MKASQLNAAAALIGTEDKAVVFGTMIQVAIDAGMTVREAFDIVLGDGRWDEMACKLYEKLNAS